MKKYQFLKIEVKNHIATVFLNNPKKANAMNRTLWLELGQAFHEMDQRSEVKVCILTGLGKHFTAGIDIGFLNDIIEECKALPQSKRRDYLYRTIKEMQNAITAVEKCRKPVIAAIHGVCIGGGVDLIAACDMRFATKLSVLSIMETRLGIVADMGTLQRLRFFIPDGLLKELAFTSRLFRGYQAEKWGLVSKSFLTKAKMMSEVEKLAAEICSLPAYAVQGTKETLNFSRERTVAEGLEFVAQMNSDLFLTAEAEVAFREVKSKNS